MEREEDLILRAASCAVSAISLQLAVARLHWSLWHASLLVASGPGKMGQGHMSFFKWYWTLEADYYGIKGKHFAK